jgi:hypothetical protein
MRASTRALGSTNRFESQPANQRASDYGTSQPDSDMKRKTSERTSHISYYEGATEVEDEHQVLESGDTISFNAPWDKNRKMFAHGDHLGEDISLVNLSAIRDDGPSEDSLPGKIFSRLPTEVSAKNFPVYSPTRIIWVVVTLGTDGQI